jgi:hypothetical protein
MTANVLKLSVLTQGRVLSKLAALPGAPAANDTHILDETHGTHPNEIVVYDNAAWVYIVPLVGWRVYNAGAGYHEEFDGTSWSEVTSGTLDGLSDVDTTGVADLDVLTYDAGTSSWVPAAPSGGGATTLDGLSDVDTTGVADLDVLTYDAGTSSWVPAAPSGGGATTLDGLSDVDTTGVADLDVLTYDAGTSSWVPAAPSGGGGGGVASGTAFPGSPADRDLFFRTDRDILYFWDNANSHWLSQELFISQLSGVNTSATLPFTAGSLSAYGPAPLGAVYDHWLIDFCGTTIMTNGSVSSNYYSMSCSPSGAVISTATNTQNVWTHKRTAINAVQTAGNWGFDVTFTKNGGGAVMYATFSVTYRLIG